MQAMPIPKPLTPSQASHSLANRFGRTADRIRQFATKFGVRPYRVFLVWDRSTGEERGEGIEVEYRRIEILPTPKVESLDAVALSPHYAGVLPVGSIRVTRISSAFTGDILSGKAIPSGQAAPGVPFAISERGEHIQEPTAFYYELIEDGRGDPMPSRSKYRLAATPSRRAGKVDWLVVLERMSEDDNRAGQSNLGDDL